MAFAALVERPGRTPGRRCCVVVGAWLLAIIAAACTPSPSPSPSASAGSSGVLFVEVGDKVQDAPPTEELKDVFSDQMNLANTNGDDLGYPWYDSATGEIVLSVVTPAGAQLIEAAAIAAPHRTRSVTHGATELRRIQDDATTLVGQGVPGAELIYMTVPDWRDNRAMIVITSASQELVDALVALYPADALAIQVNPMGAP